MLSPWYLIYTIVPIKGLFLRNEFSSGSWLLLGALPCLLPLLEPGCPCRLHHLLLQLRLRRRVYGQLMLWRHLLRLLRQLQLRLVG